MAFGMEGIQRPEWSKEHLILAIQKLQEEPPRFGENTGEIDGKYMAMGFPVEKDDYDAFIEKLNTLLDETTQQKEDELDQAA